MRHTAVCLYDDLYLIYIYVFIGEGYAGPEGEGIGSAVDGVLELCGRGDGMGGNVEADAD